MKKLLLLGTSLASVEIIQTAKAMGCYTIVTDDLMPEYSAAKMVADEYWMISTDDLDTLELKCREERINAVFAGVSEFNLDMVKELTSRLDLPCYIESKAWKYARDKKIFKEKCRELGIPVVEEYAVSDPPAAEELIGIEYPVVVKPVDGTGNKGLSICHNEEELLNGCEKARNNSDSRDILVERYVTGEETWNYYYLAGGEIRYVYSGRVYRQPGYPTFLYSFGTSAVSNQEYRTQLSEKCIAFLRDIGCRKGVAWFQFIRDENNRYYALEMAQRISADSTGKILENAVGVNALGWMLNVAFGDDHDIDELPASIEPPYRTSCCVYYLFADRSGTICSMQGFEKLPEEEFTISIIAHKGSYIDKYRNMVRIVFNARNGNEMCDKIKLINNSIKILNEKGDNMYIHFTDYDQVIVSNKGLFLYE